MQKNCTIKHFPGRYSVAECEDSATYIIDDLAFRPCIYKDMKSCKAKIIVEKITVPLFDKKVEIVSQLIMNKKVYTNIRRKYAEKLVKEEF